MKKIEIYVNYGFVGADRKKIIEIDDDITDEEIEKLIWKWATNYICIDWEEVEKD